MLGNYRPYLFLDGEKDCSLVIKENTQILVQIADFSLFHSRKFSFVLEKNSSLIVALADFSKGKGNLHFDASLLGEGASFLFDGSSLATKEDSKNIEVNVIHQTQGTKSLTSMHGIASGNSHLIFSGLSKINKGAKKSETRQEAKIIMFDQSSFSRCSPALKIEENDVIASHGAVEGRLSDLELFYLESRGIEEKEARRLIAFGYLSPVSRYFHEEIKEKILSSSEGGI